MLPLQKSQVTSWGLATGASRCGPNSVGPLCAGRWRRLRRGVASSGPPPLGAARPSEAGCPPLRQPLRLFIQRLFPYRLWPLSASRRESLGRGRRGGKGEGRGRSFLPPSSSPRPGKRQHIEARGSQHQARDANEGERVPTARTLCRAAHLLFGEHPLCPRQFTGNLACADGPAPLCGPRRHWPPSVGTAAAPGPQAPARRPRLYRGRPAPPGRAWPPARRSPLADRLSPRRHGPQPRGRGAAQPQREKPTAEARGGEDAPRPHQQQHRAAETAAGAGVRAPPAQLQAGEGRHPGDGCQLPEAQQSLRRRRRPQEPAPGLQRGLLVVPAGGRAVPDAARGQRHADEAAVPLPATLGRAWRPHQGAQGVGAHPRQGPRRCAPALLRPLAALVTWRDVRAAASGPEGQPFVPLVRREALPGHLPRPGLGRPLLSEGSLQAGGPTVGSF